LEDVIPSADGETISAKKSFKDKQPGGQHSLDKVSASMDIEPRLAASLPANERHGRTIQLPGLAVFARRDNGLCAA